MSYFTGASNAYKQSQQDTDQRGSDSELPLVRSRSRWMVHNNGYATSALLKCVTNWVGRGIVGHWSNPELQKLWEQFIKKPTFDGRGNFATYQTMLANSVFTDGELFVRFHYENDSSEIPFSIEPISAMHCPTAEEDTLYTQDVATRKKLGIVYKQRTGKVSKYRFENYLKETKEQRFDWIDHKLIEVDAAEIIHTFEAKFANQRRGVPILLPAILPLWELQDLTDATITKQQASQAVGWIVQAAEDSNVFPQMGTAVSQPSTTTSSPLHGFMSDSSPSQAVPMLEEITPGGVHYLRRGEQIKFAETQDVGRNLPVLMNHLLRKLASSCGLMYEQLTGDLTQVNYSSIRAGRIDFLMRTEQFRQQIIIDSNLQIIAEKFREVASMWTNTDFSEARIEWTPPRVHGIDQLKDVKSDMMELEGDKPLATWRSKVAERGINFDDHLKQLKEEKKYVSKNYGSTSSSSAGKRGEAGGDSGGSVAPDTGGGASKTKQ